MSTSPINPMPFDKPDESDINRDQGEEPLYESGQPDSDEVPEQENPDDQLPASE